MNKHVINNNSSLADLMTFFIEASGLQERIAEIVKDAIVACLHHRSSRTIPRTQPTTPVQNSASLPTLSKPRYV